MRIVLLLMIFLVKTPSLIAQNQNFSILLKIEGLDSGYYKFRLTEIIGVVGNSILFNDSLSKGKNSIVITGFIPEERYVYLSIRRVGEFDFGLGPGDSASITLKNGKKWDNFLVTGSSRVVQSSEYLNRTSVFLSDKLKNQKTRMDSLILATASKKKMETAQLQYDSIYNSIFISNTLYADTVSSAVAAAIALEKYVYEKGKYNIFSNISRGIKKFGNLPTFQSLMASYNDTSYKVIVTKIDSININNSFNVSTTNKIKKILLKNKLILIDFWASWCKPCIEEFPFLDSAYNKFKKKGFEIVSISLDEDSLLWQKAKKRFNMTWSNHFIEKEAFNSRLAKVLNIKSIPRSYLIDKNGRIYGKNLRGSQLQEMLSKLL